MGVVRPQRILVTGNFPLERGDKNESSALPGVQYHKAPALQGAGRQQGNKTTHLSTDSLR